MEKLRLWFGVGLDSLEKQKNNGEGLDCGTENIYN